jgi:hypothetical protein
MAFDSLRLSFKPGLEELLSVSECFLLPPFPARIIAHDGMIAQVIWRLRFPDLAQRG